MRVDDGLLRYARREPDEAELPAGLRDPQREPLAPEPTPAAPPPDTPPPFWTAGTPVPPNALNDLPPAPVSAPPEPLAAPPAQPAAMPAPAASPAAYAGEPPVDAAWLAEREAAFTAVRQDYEAARAAAQAQVGGIGWSAVTPYTDESGQPISPDGRPMVHVADPNAQPEIAGWDEGGPVYRQPAGTWYTFDESAFAAQYQTQAQAQAGAPLQSLARLYDTDAAGLLARHPEIWPIAIGDHALNAGPPPAGRAMGDAAQLGMIDLYLADPQVRSLVDAYGGTATPAASPMALEQVRVYGAERYAEMSRLGFAMASVRQHYSDAMAQAHATGGPGWTERPRRVATYDESGGMSQRPLVFTDESGAATPVIDRVFDPDAFTAWYLQQPGLSNQAFASFYGRSHTTYATDESGASHAAGIRFDNPNWSMYGPGGGMGHDALLSIDPNAPPRLNDPGAVGFDLEAGWATGHGNLHRSRDWFGTLVQVAIVGVVSYVSAGTLGPAVAGAVGATGTAATVVSAAVAGAAGSLASGMMSGNLQFKDVLRGALAGGLSAGLTNGLSSVVAPAGTAGTIALRTTVQGGIQALLGGDFKDGALAGFASGLADAAGASLQEGIDKAIADGTMGAGEAFAARNFARVIGSAIRAAGNPGDPASAFAGAFLDDVLRQAGATAPAPVAQTAFDDDGNLMPGVVDPAASLEEQQAQLAGRLVDQGIGQPQAEQMAAGYFDEVRAFETAFVGRQPDPVLLADASGGLPVRSARQVIDGIEDRISRGDLLGSDIRDAIDEAYQAYLGLASAAERSGAAPSVQDERAAARLISLITDLGQVAREQHYELNPEQAQLLRLAQGYQAQRYLPDIYGAAVGGGILALRQNHRLQAIRAWDSNPNLRHPDQTVGRSDGGPGQWGYAPARSGGQAYQEQVTGVPRGVEYNVNGVWFDGYDSARRVLVDSKDWVNYPPATADFWQSGAVQQARLQVGAARGSGATVELHVSSQQAADALNSLFARTPDLNAQVRAVFVPKR